MYGELKDAARLESKKRKLDWNLHEGTPRSGVKLLVFELRLTLT